MPNYSNSPLVEYVKISPYKNSGRVEKNLNPTGAIDKITIHHMAGNLTIETCANVFQNSKASSNYGIGSDGRMAMYVEEKDRSWASSNAANDYRAITIEVANDGGDSTGWHVSDEAIASLIKLCVDVCKRNGIPKLIYTGDPSGNVTRHNMFVATACPGPYLQSKFDYIVEQVNAQIAPPAPAPAPEVGIKGGDVVSIKPTATHWTTGSEIPDWVRSYNWYVDSVSGDRAVLGKNVEDTNNIQSPIKTSDLTLVKSSTDDSPKNEPKVEPIKEGDRVRMSTNAVVYETNQKFDSFVYKSDLYVRELVGSRAVVSTQAQGAITGPVDVKYLTKI